ncbi:MAG: protein phosphatase 2C domain-containing protein [Oscillospiraceae bacterium]|nr:protein phosphatase 2C domain-containing protein [Oscillospiraceae bacterium]
MDYTIWASTDCGLRKKSNQDSISLTVADTPMGKCCFGIVCDGMGGLSDGEVASGTVIQQFRNWFETSFPLILAEGGDVMKEVSIQWDVLASRLNECIRTNGAAQGIRLGTTATVILFYQDQYTIMNIGDTRIYEITGEGITQLTEDQSFVNREVKEGRMTEEEARMDERRNILLQCIGASPSVYPDTYSGTTKRDAIYMLCVDGFRHEISSEEFAYYFSPQLVYTKKEMEKSCAYLISENMRRHEQDNITVGVIRTS